MLFSLVTVLGSWCFADRRDSDIPTVKAFKKSHTFMYVYIATWCWQRGERGNQPLGLTWQQDGNRGGRLPRLSRDEKRDHPQ